MGRLLVTYRWRLKWYTERLGHGSQKPEYNTLLSTISVLYCIANILHRCALCFTAKTVSVHLNL